MKSALLAALLLLAVAGGALAEDAILDLQGGDIDRVQLELTPKKRPKMVIYLGLKKLVQAQILASNNQGKPLFIVMNGQTVLKPTITDTLVSRGKISLSFPDMDSAVGVMKLLVPGK
jgi:hypothetical protein